MPTVSRYKKVKSINSGSHHWWLQRLTAIMLVPLVIWLVALVLRFIIDQTYIIQSPIHFVLLIALLTTALIHSRLGIQVVIEDYIHCNRIKYGLFILLNMTISFTLIAVIFAIFRIFLILF